MPAILQDLWPTDFGSLDTVPPVAILREQAYFLGQRTQGVVEGEVKTENKGGNANIMVHRLFAYAPALNGYRVELLWVEHDVSVLYPLKMMGFSEDIADEERFRELLRQQLNSSYTKGIIQSLYVQSLGLSNQAA